MIIYNIKHVEIRFTKLQNLLNTAEYSLYDML